MDDYLMHYGRKGMKWYQHIYGEVQSGAKYAQKGGGNAKGTITKNGKTSNKDDSKSSSSEDNSFVKKSKKVSEMSDAELKKLVDRANLEKQYRDLQPKKINLGQRLVNNVLLPVMEQQLKNYLNQKIGQKIQKSLAAEKAKSNQSDSSKQESKKPEVSKEDVQKTKEPVKQAKPELSKLVKAAKSSFKQLTDKRGDAAAEKLYQEFLKRKKS